MYHIVCGLCALIKHTFHIIYASIPAGIHSQTSFVFYILVITLIRKKMLLIISQHTFDSFYTHLCTLHDVEDMLLGLNH